MRRPVSLLYRTADHLKLSRRNNNHSRHMRRHVLTEPCGVAADFYRKLVVRPQRCNKTLQIAILQPQLLELFRPSPSCKIQAVKLSGANQCQYTVSFSFSVFLCHVEQNLGVEIFRVRHSSMRDHRAPVRTNRLASLKAAFWRQGRAVFVTRSSPVAAIFKNDSYEDSRTSTPCLPSTPKISGISEPTFAGKSIHTVFVNSDDILVGERIQIDRMTVTKNRFVCKHLQACESRTTIRIRPREDLLQYKKLNRKAIPCSAD